MTTTVPRDGIRPGARSRSRQEFAVAALLAAAVTAAWRLIIPLQAPDCCDASQYAAMAHDPGQAVPTPYSYRILVPRVAHWLAERLGGDPLVWFAAVSVVCLWLAGPLLYRLLRDRGVGNATALLAMVAFLCSRGITYYVANPFLSDPAAMLLVVAAFLAVVHRRVGVLALVLVLFAGVRETFAGFALPAYQYLRRRAVDPKVLLVVGLAVLPAWACYQAVVATAPATGIPGYGRLSAGIVAEVWRTRVAPDHAYGAANGAYWVLNTFTMSLGVWWALAAWGWRDRSIRPLWWWLVAVFGQFLFGGDWSRFALYAFPVVMLAGAAALARHPRRRLLHWLVAAQLAVPLADAAAGHVAINYPGPSLVVGGVLLTVTAVAVAWPSRAAGERAGAPDDSLADAAGAASRVADTPLEPSPLSAPH